MALSKKIAIPLFVVTLTAAVAAGWLYKTGWFKDDGDGHSKLEHKIQLWTCSMHPFIVKDKPGTCPICGMELIKKVDGASGDAAQTPEQKQQAAALGHVALSPTQRVMANVATIEAKQGVLSKEITAVGTVQFDQTRQAKVTAWIAGRIDKLYVNRVGDLVHKDRPVADIYSPDLLATQQEYLLAVKSRDQLKNSPISAISKNGDGLVASARQRLMLFGVKESQIAELEKAGQPNIRLPIYTPQSGIVIEKMVQTGQYVNVGDTLFNVADLSRIWVELEVYENELSTLKTGQAVQIESPFAPARTLGGQITYIYPFLDPKTRTAKARVELSNPGLRLKPDMFVKAAIKVPLGSALVVPLTAVMDSGTRKTVWVETQPGVFEPREVQTGQQNDEKVQILSGLKRGDKVAVSGGYLIDSESQLKGGGGQDHSQHGGGAAKPEEKKQAPAKPKLNMDDMKM